LKYSAVRLISKSARSKRWAVLMAALPPGRAPRLCAGLLCYPCLVARAAFRPLNCTLAHSPLRVWAKRCRVRSWRTVTAPPGYILSLSLHLVLANDLNGTIQRDGALVRAAAVGMRPPDEDSVRRLHQLRRGLAREA